MALSAAQYSAYKNMYRYGFDWSLALFDEIDNSTFLPTVTAGYSLATSLKPVGLISPPYSRTPVGVPVTLYGGDSIERGGTAATGHTWSLESGSAIVSPSGTQCTVTPTGSPGEIVVIKLTVTASNTNTNDRYAYIYTGAWEPGAVESFSFTGSFDAHGWQGEMRITDRTADFDGLAAGKLILFHMTPYWNGAAMPIGGYKRAENICLLRVKDWNYNKSNQTTTIELESPAEELDRVDYYFAYTDYDSDTGAIRYWNGSSDPTAASEYRYITDLAMSDAVWDIVAGADSAVAEHYNCTIFDDTNTFQRFTVNQGSFRQQLIDVMASQVNSFFCNYTGSIQMIPARNIRGDEYWAVPSPVFTSGQPITKDFVFNEGDPKSWRVQYHETTRYTSAKIVGQKFDTNNIPVETSIYYPNTGIEGKQTYVKSGIYIPSVATAQTWAADYYAEANREFDIDFTLLGSNMLNVADDIYLSLTPDPSGLGALALEDAYIKEVRHNISGLNTGMPQWLTSYHAEQITAGS